MSDQCIKRVATWRDQFSLVTWFLDAMLSPNAAQPNGQTSLAPPCLPMPFLGNTMGLQWQVVLTLTTYTALINVNKSDLYIFDFAALALIIIIIIILKQYSQSNKHSSKRLTAKWKALRQ